MLRYRDGGIYVVVSRHSIPIIIVILSIHFLLRIEPLITPLVPQTDIILSHRTNLKQNPLNILLIRSRAIQVLQRHNLSFNLAILVDENRRRIAFRIALNAQVRADLAELDVAEFDGHLAPQLREHARLHIRAQRRRQVDQHKRPRALLGDVARVVRLLQREHLAVDALLLQGRQLRQALLAVPLEEGGVLLLVLELVEFVQILVLQPLLVRPSDGLEKGFLDDWLRVWWLFGDDAVFA